MKRGKLLVIEGIDCAGKDTQINHLQLRLTREGFNVLSIREPGGTKIGESLRTILKNPQYKDVIHPVTSLLLFNAARLQLVTEVIRPVLDQGLIVLSNRSYLSTLAYQGHAEGLPLELISQICQVALDGLIPDRILLLDISVEEMLRRMKLRGGSAADRYDSLDSSFHQKVRDGYLKEAENQSPLVKIIYGQQSEREVAVDIWNRVKDLLS